MLSLLCQLYQRDKTQGCQNPGSQVAVVNKFCTVAPNICGFSTSKSLYVTLLVPNNFEVDLRVLESLCTPAITYDVI